MCVTAAPLIIDTLEASLKVFEYVSLRVLIFWNEWPEDSPAS